MLTPPPAFGRIVANESAKAVDPHNGVSTVLYPENLTVVVGLEGKLLEAPDNPHRHTHHQPSNFSFRGISSVTTLRKS